MLSTLRGIHRLYGEAIDRLERAEVLRERLKRLLPLRGCAVRPPPAAAPAPSIAA